LLIFEAVKKGDLQLLSQALNLGQTPIVSEQKGVTPIHLASKLNRVSFLKVFEKLKVPFNVKDKKGRTPLHYAAASGSLEAVDFLISRGAPVNEGDIEERTPVGVSGTLVQRNASSVRKAGLVGTGCKSANQVAEADQVRIKKLRELFKSIRAAL